MTTPDVGTNFAQYSHQQLYAMLYAGNPDSARKAAAAWNDTGNGLHDQANQLSAKLTGFSQAWQGGAANQYQRMIQDLIGGLQKVADTAYKMRDVSYEVADAQDTARAQMPPPVDVPQLPAATLALASAPIQIDAGTPASVVAQIQQARANAITAVQGQQQASAAADAAHAKAVQVMTTLAGAYVAAKDSIPPSPDAGTTAAISAGSGIRNDVRIGTPISTVGLSRPTPNPLTWNQPGALPGTTTPGSGTATSGVTSGALPTTQTESPLFGDMFSAGVAAASAAVFGRFGSLVPKVPGFVNKNSKSGGDGGGDGGAVNPDGSTPKLGDRVAAEQAAAATKFGGAGGGAALGSLKGLGGGGIGGVGGVGGVGAPTPSASASMLGAGNVGGDMAAGVAGAAGVAARSASGTPMMPMMPMGGMGGGNDMGNGRRIPPWLVETEDVWGESSAVSPTVIGEEPDLGGQGWLG